MKDTPWREVLFGRRVKEDESLEAVRREWDAAVAQDLSSLSAKPAAHPTIVPAPITLNTQSTPSKRPTFL
ncbi:hypothetical protein FRC12_022253 [Ceratobasidium sp. 428]|nr:hypothetical protein FRC12_022253 [Ceratobasidium sp. 428]